MLSHNVLKNVYIKYEVSFQVKEWPISRMGPSMKTVFSAASISSVSVSLCVAALLTQLCTLQGSKTDDYESITAVVFPKEGKLMLSIGWLVFSVITKLWPLFQENYLSKCKNK